ncbi:MAG: hypothetical protein EBZ77_07130, partial [Chitinophagia bacterium]|nr:hypothetical protein [Chitinophagia bacterium]
MKKIPVLVLGLLFMSFGALAQHPFDGTETVITTWNVGGYSGDGGPATAAHIETIAASTFDRNGNIYIGSNDYRIRKINPAGFINTIAGYGVDGYTGDGGPGASAQIGTPSLLTTDTAGNLYLFCRGTYGIRMVNHATGIITTVAGSDTALGDGEGGPATNAHLGELTAMYASPNGKLYFAVSGKIRSVNLATGIISNVAGTGSWSFSGDGGPATAAEITRVYSMVTDHHGNLLFYDESNFRIRKVDTSGIITTFGGNPNFAKSDGCPVTAAYVSNGPLGVDASDNIYLGQTIINTDNIRKINATTGIINLIHHRDGTVRS